VFCSFLALVLRNELEQRLTAAGHRLEWAEIKQDLKALKEVEIDEGAARFAVRTEFKNHCAKIFKAVGVAPPPTIRKLH
jgi:hypothetical protein